MSHTPIPWKLVEKFACPLDVYGEAEIHGTTRYPLLTLEICDEETAANAHFIVTAVNCHAELLAALKKLPLDYFDKPEEKLDAADFVDCSNDFLAAMKAARAAIAKAEWGG